MIERCTISLWFVKETELARQYSKLPPERHPEQSDYVWLPKSQIERTTKFPTGEHHLVLPLWLVEKHGL